MNPVTQNLIDQVNDPAIIEYVARWDDIESLVIRVYRGAAASRKDEQDFISTKRWLQKRHPHWQAALEPYWRQVIIEGDGAVTADPFARILDYDQALDFIGNWDAMRLLPAIRQAINHWVLDLVEKP
jgi:hypothetical protein